MAAASICFREGPFACTEYHVLRPRSAASTEMTKKSCEPGELCASCLPGAIAKPSSSGIAEGLPRLSSPRLHCLGLHPEIAPQDASVWIMQARHRQEADGVCRADRPNRNARLSAARAGSLPPAIQAPSWPRPPNWRPPGVGAAPYWPRAPNWRRWAPVLRLKHVRIAIPAAAPLTTVIK